MTEDDRCRLENENAKLRSLVRGLMLCETMSGSCVVDATGRVVYNAEKEICHQCPLYDTGALYKRCRKNQRLAEVGMDDLI